MAALDSPIGRKVQRRLRREQIIWLVTVDARHTPQPRPVWFHWDGETVLVLSQPGAAKVRHVARNPRVALHFNTDDEGGSVGVLIGEALIARSPVNPQRLKAYLRKYRERIKSLGMTAESLQGEYATTIVITPRSVRGF
ncbi:MAG: TIGR03667 family PPOX class F420-dependent oxidoreductase [Armatimonadota bacterium]|nr:TIGR03667 family PPOX class F420-dependent oxidoreductase [Armatimonadota bacterium]